VYFFYMSVLRPCICFHSPSILLKSLLLAYCSDTVAGRPSFYKVLIAKWPSWMNCPLSPQPSPLLCSVCGSAVATGLSESSQEMSVPFPITVMSDILPPLSHRVPGHLQERPCPVEAVGTFCTISMALVALAPRTKAELPSVPCILMCSLTPDYLGKRDTW
jgi:hypothetical protein